MRVPVTAIARRLTMGCLAACLWRTVPLARAQAPSSGGADTSGTTFIVRIENVSNRGTLKLSTGGSVAIPLSGGVWAVHTGGSPIFTPGAPEAGIGLKGLAEAGITDPFAANLRTLRNVRAADVFDKPKGHRRGMPKGDVDRKTASKMLQPGQYFEFSLRARRGERLSFAMMLAQANDAVVATPPSGLELFDASGRPVSGDVTSRTTLWDAGTEVNEQAGVGRNQGLRQGAPHAGDPERRPVRPLGDAEFGQLWPAADRIVRVTIKPGK